MELHESREHGGILKAELAALVDDWDVERGGEKGRVKDLTQVFNFSHSGDGGDILFSFIFLLISHLVPRTKGIVKGFLTTPQNADAIKDG